MNTNVKTHSDELEWPQWWGFRSRQWWLLCSDSQFFLIFNFTHRPHAFWLRSRNIGAPYIVDNVQVQKIYIAAQLPIGTDPCLSPHGFVCSFVRHHFKNQFRGRSGDVHIQSRHFVHTAFDDEGINVKKKKRIPIPLWHETFGIVCSLIVIPCTIILRQCSSCTSDTIELCSNAP